MTLKAKFVVSLAFYSLFVNVVFIGLAHADTEKLVRIIFADMDPPNTINTVTHEWWGSEIEKRAQGKIEFEYFWGGSLLSPYEQLSSVKNNVIQVTPYYSGYHPDIAPIPTIGLLPMINSGTLKSALEAADEFYRTNPEVQKEFKKNNVKYMSVAGSTGHHYFWSKRPVQKIADFEGMPVRTFGPFLTLFEALGCSLVSVPITEIYNSLERGVVEATTQYMPVSIGLRLTEVTKYLLKTNLGHNCGKPIVMNLDTWKKLSPETQNIIENININEAIHKYAEYDQKYYKQNMQDVIEAGLTIRELSAKEIDILQQLAKNVVWEPYAKKLEKKGLPGNEILKDYLRIIKKHSN